MSATLIAAEKSAPVSEPALDRIEQRLTAIERLIQNQGLLDMLQQIQRLQQEVTELRGQIEVNQHEMEKLSERQRKLYNDLDERVTRLDQPVSRTGTPADEAPPLEIITPVEEVTTAGTGSDAALTVETLTPETTDEESVADEETLAEEMSVEEETVPPLEEQALQQPAPQESPLVAQSQYQEAFGLLRNADYDQAIIEFDKFLAKYPDSKYSDNAQYWMGEAYYVTRRFNDAITEYMKLISNYPDSQKVPNGLLKIAYSYYELGQKEEGNRILKELIERYPDSSAASDAEKRLQQGSTS